MTYPAVLSCISPEKGKSTYQPETTACLGDFSVTGHCACGSERDFSSRPVYGMENGCSQDEESGVKED